MGYIVEAGQPLDDLRLYLLSPGSYRLESQAGDRHAPHLARLLLIRDGNFNLEGEKPVSVKDRSALLFPWEPTRIALREPALLLDVPSYRLGLCPLLPMRHYLHDSSQALSLSVLLVDLSQEQRALDPTAQRYIAKAICDLARLPEPAQLASSDDCSFHEHHHACIEIAQLMFRQAYDERLRPDQVANALGISRAHLYRLIAKSGGFKACLNAKRLDNVAQALKNPGYDRTPIKGLLYKNGFSSTEQFQRLFRQRFKISARAFRQPGASTHFDTPRLEALK